MGRVLKRRVGNPPQLDKLPHMSGLSYLGFACSSVGNWAGLDLLGLRLFIWPPRSRWRGMFMPLVSSRRSKRRSRSWLTSSACFGIEDEVAAFERIFLQVVEFVDIPDALIADELVAIRANGVLGRRLGEVALPIVFVEQLLAPFSGLALRERKPALAVETGRDWSAGDIENSGHNVETGTTSFTV